MEALWKTAEAREGWEGGTAEVTEGYKWEPAGLSEAALAPTLTFSSFPHPLPLNFTFALLLPGILFSTGHCCTPGLPYPEIDSTSYNYVYKSFHCTLSLSQYFWMISG